jgi:hypothetical protein
MNIGGTVARSDRCGAKLNTTVMPFICAECSCSGRQRQLPDGRRQTSGTSCCGLASGSRASGPTIEFDDLPTHFDAYLKGLVRGRTVVRIAADSHP